MAWTMCDVFAAVRNVVVQLEHESLYTIYTFLVGYLHLGYESFLK